MKVEFTSPAPGGGALLGILTFYKEEAFASKEFIAIYHSNGHIDVFDHPWSGGFTQSQKNTSSLEAAIEWAKSPECR